MVNLAKYFRSMHYVTIEALVIVALFHRLGQGGLLNVIAAIVTASVVDITLKKFWLRQKLSPPLSAIITGLIVGLVTPFANNPIAVIIPSVLGVLSKFVIRLKGTHIFNPAVIGVVASILLFSSIASHAPPEAAGHMTAEANLGGFSVNLLLVPLLVYASYTSRKLWLSVSNLITSGLLYLLGGLTSTGALVLALPYFFSFIIASEPKTTPNLRNQQLIFGVTVAILPFVPLLFSRPYNHIGALISLLIGNLAYAIYRPRA